MQRNPICFLPVSYNGYPVTQADKFSFINTLRDLLQAIYHPATNQNERLAFALKHQSILFEEDRKFSGNKDYLVEHVLTILNALIPEERSQYAEAMLSLIKNGNHLKEIIETFPEATRYDFAKKHKNVISNNIEAANVIKVLPVGNKFQFAKDVCQPKPPSKWIGALLVSLAENDRYSFYVDYLRNKMEAIEFNDLVVLLDALKQENFISVATESHSIVTVETHFNSPSKLLEILTRKIIFSDIGVDQADIYQVAKLYGFVITSNNDLMDVIKRLQIFGIPQQDLIEYFNEFKREPIENFNRLHDLIVKLRKYINYIVATNLFLQYKSLVATLNNLLTAVKSLGYQDDRLESLSYHFLSKHFNLDNLIQNGSELSQFLDITHVSARTHNAYKFHSKIKNVDELISVVAYLPATAKYEFIIYKSDLIIDRTALIKMLQLMGVETKSIYISRFKHLIDEAYENVSDINGLYELAMCLAGTEIIDYKRIKPTVFVDFNCFDFIVRELENDTEKQKEFINLYKNAIREAYQVIIVMNKLPENNRIDFLKAFKETITTQEGISLILNEFPRHLRLQIALIYCENLALQDASTICGLLSENDKQPYMQAVSASSSPTLSLRSLFRGDTPALMVDATTPNNYPTLN
jgi:hypothetical protein